MQPFTNGHANGAINGAAANGNDYSITAENGTSDTDWFKEAAPILLGSDPGLALHVLTGVPERTCYYYASGDRYLKLPIFRTLCHGGHGWQWLNAFMGDCKAEWWLDLKWAYERHLATKEVDAKHGK